VAVVDLAKGDVVGGKVMSAMGQKQTSRPQFAMSAIPPIADIRQRDLDVRATHEKARIVKDGNVITAGGVTSEIDFGLSMVAEIAGETTAQAIQLGLEYNPDPPLDAGHPDCAPDAAKDTVFPRYERARSAFRDGIARLSTA
jgi:hypothetical protein